MQAVTDLSPLPPDALLGIMAAYRQDQRPEKIDLGVGVYRDDSGDTPIMAAVREAEAALLRAQTTKAYEGPRGNAAFCQAVEQLVFGAPSTAVASLATPGGCGALFLAIHFAKRLSAAPTVWISNPSWPNHKAIAEKAGLSVRDYPYVDEAGQGVCFDAMLDALSSASAGDVIVLQGPCHNPTGVDLTVDQWKAIAALVNEKQLIALIDIAYHGLGTGLEDDLIGVRAALDSLSFALVSYSCSKNFGLYRERTGCILAKCKTQTVAETVFTHLADIARASYSMPPANGPALVEIILSDPDLRQLWQDELTRMRARIQGLRASLAEGLAAHTGDAAYGALKQQRGMFSQLPLPSGAAERLAKEDALYLPNSGRINVAGLQVQSVERAAQLLAGVL